MEAEKPQSDDNDMIEIDDTYEEVLDDPEDENVELNKSGNDLDDVLASKVKIPQSTASKPPVTVVTTAAETPKSKPQKIITPNAITSSAGGSQKIVIIQNGTNNAGKQQQIRMAGNTSQIRSIGSSSTKGIQLIKTSDGTYLQIKNKTSDGSSIGTTTTTTTSAAVATAATGSVTTSGGRFIVKSSNGSRILLSTPTSIKPVASHPGTGNSLITLASGTSGTKTISSTSGGIGGSSRQVTVAEAQKLGLISSAKYKEIVSVVNKHQKSQQQLNNVTATTTTGTVSVINSTKIINTTTNTAVPNQTRVFKSVTSTTDPKATGSLSFPSATTLISQQKLQSLTAGKPNVAGAAKKIIIQTTSGIQKQVMLPPHLYELAQKGQIRAVSIAGKGVQYVRVPPQTAKPVTAATTTTTTTSSTITSSTNKPPIMTISANSKLTPTIGSGGGGVLIQNNENKSIISGTRVILPRDSGLSVAGSQTIGLKVEKKPHPYQIMAVKRYSDQSSNNTIDNQKRIINFEKSSSSQVRRSTPSMGYVSDIVGVNNTIKLEVDRDIGSVSNIDYGNNDDVSGGDADDTTDHRFGRPRMYHNNQNINLKYEGDKADFPSPIKTHAYTTSTSTTTTTTIQPTEEMEGIRRKHCNCTKSQCLKLYCDCFANGEFCANCNCKDCFNNLENQDERQKAIRMCLERNPHAFKPKIGKAKDQTDQLSRRHTKGCNCKRSGCLKNYCECYEAKIGCSDNCRCIDCRNFDDHSSVNRFATNILGASSSGGGGVGVDGDGIGIGASNRYHPNRRSYSQTGLADNSNDSLGYLDKSRSIQLKRRRRSISNSSQSPSPPPPSQLNSLDLLSTSSYSMMAARSSGGVDPSGDLLATTSSVTKKPCNFMTPDVIEATIQCLIAQADECQKNNINPRLAEKLIIEEFGRCLVEIIEFSLKNNENE